MNEQRVVARGIRMSRGVEPIFVIKQETTFLPKVKPTLVKGVPMVIRVKYSEPRHNH